MKIAMLFTPAVVSLLLSCGGGTVSGTATQCVDGDGDGDGYGTGAGCSGPDCDDANPAVHPGSQEICGNGIDEDCSGADLSCGAGCADADADGYGVGAQCTTQQDCDDGNPQKHPGGAEICGNGIDEDCSGADLPCGAGCIDNDHDGAGVGTQCVGVQDCDDNNPQRTPGKIEICGNGIDEDCSGADLPCGGQCADNDQDGWGVGAQCGAAQDCDDNDPLVNPGRNEVCGNGKDDDCQGGDMVCPGQCTDADHDGYGEGSDCDGPDCNDNDALVHPGAREMCGNGVDEDCAGGDQPCGAQCADNDHDGYGQGDGCQGPDCNDANPAVHPGAQEVCENGVDDDCSGGDAECPSQCTDNDSDGYGRGNGCLGPDCDDGDYYVNPGEIEICENGIDDDCTGGDAACAGCESDAECFSDEMCDRSTGDCRAPELYEYWAPVIYHDADDACYGCEYLTTFDYDWDTNGNNNWDNLDVYAKPAYVYYSVLESGSHYFIGYYIYHPRLWASTWGDRQFANDLKAAFLVIRKGGGYGDLVLMETTTYKDFYQYAPSGSSLGGGAANVDGQLRFDSSGHHPILYVKSEGHDIYGAPDFAHGVGAWESGGFPGGDGIIYRYGNYAAEPESGNDPDVSYAFLPVEYLWDLRDSIGATRAFSKFGVFNGGTRQDGRSFAPWALNDQDEAHPAGEVFYDPADFFLYHFKNGWGTMSDTYRSNKYAIMVTAETYEVFWDRDGPWDGSDGYLKIIMRDGLGNEWEVLDADSGLQNSWRGENNDGKGVIYLGSVMGRNYFYGIEDPSYSYFGVESRDWDATTGDDWLMDPETRQYYSYTGSLLLNWSGSEAEISVDYPAAP